MKVVLTKFNIPFDDVQESEDTETETVEDTNEKTTNEVSRGKTVMFIIIIPFKV
jgi:hypothetical protein